MVGKATRRTDAARARLAAMDARALAAGRTFWLDHAPPDRRGLIDAEPDPRGMAAGPGAVWRFLRDSRLFRRVRAGADLALTAVREAIESVVARAEALARGLADALRNLKIPIPAWQARMEALIRQVHAAAGLIGGGGRRAITPAEIAAIETRLAEQFGFLEAFAAEIEDGLPLGAGLAARAALYAAAAIGTYEAARRVGDLAAGFRYERRILHSGESCRSCREYAALGWQPAGSLPGIGQACECQANCKCSYERSKSPPGRKLSASAAALLRTLTPMNLYQRHAGDLWAIREDVFLARLREPAGVSGGLLAGPAPGPGSPPAMDAPPAPPYTLVNGVAVIPVYGTIYRHSTYLDDLTAWATGGVSVDRLTAALVGAVADPAARSILFTFDSPGGQASGIGSLAAAIRKAGAVKPVAAFVEHMGCSAAYYLASAAGEIVAAPDSFVGSIGCVRCVTDVSALQEKMGIKEIAVVSSQSPDKWPDPMTDQGLSLYQRQVDSFAAVMYSDIAKYRGIDVATVLSDFGKGGILIASDARKAGMIDRVGSMDAMLSKLAGSNRTRLAITRPAAATAALVSPSTSSPTPPPGPLRVRLRTLTRH